MLSALVLILIVALALLLAYAASRPDSFRVERAIRIEAPPERVFALIDDFHRWPDWSPWEKLDPAMKRSHSGADRGMGAVYGWEGNGKVGAGRMEIAEIETPTLIRIQLDFIRPFAAHNIGEFVLRPHGDGTHVTWAMFGPSPFVAKVMSLFFNMDRMVGKDFEAGLATLKVVAEREVATAP